MINRKQIARESVLRCAAEFARLGWHVFFPIDEDGAIDLAIYKDGVFKRVQVKARKAEVGRIILKNRSTNNWSIRKYTCKECDLIVLYDYTLKAAYMINLHDIEGLGEVVFRYKPTKNNQVKRVRLAEDHLFFNQAGDQNLLNTARCLGPTPL